MLKDVVDRARREGLGLRVLLVSLRPHPWRAEGALADVAATVGMKPGHAHKLQRWLREKAAAVAGDDA